MESNPTITKHSQNVAFDEEYHGKVYLSYNIQIETLINKPTI